MKIINNVYWGKNFNEKDKEKYLKKIIKLNAYNNRTFRGVYIIVITNNNSNLFEIVKINEFAKIDNIDKGLLLVGFTKSREDYIQIVQEISQKQCHKYGCITKPMLIKELTNEKVS